MLAEVATDAAAPTTVNVIDPLATMFVRKADVGVGPSRLKAAAASVPALAPPAVTATTQLTRYMETAPSFTLTLESLIHSVASVAVANRRALGLLRAAAFPS
jgi:hypothetical protein